MRETLKNLVKLQVVDTRIKEIEEVRDSYPARVAELREEVERKEHNWDGTRERLQEISKERRLKEMELASEKEKLKKWEKRLMESKNSREATALSREIDSQKRLNQENEEHILQLMGEEEERTHQADELKSKVEKIREKLEEEEKESKKITSGMDEDLAVLRVEREGLLPNIDLRMVRVYDQIRKRRGNALAPAREDGSCGGCNMSLPPQLFNQVQRMDSRLTCPSCNRILYWERGLEDVKAP